MRRAPRGAPGRPFERRSGAYGGRAGARRGDRAAARGARRQPHRGRRLPLPAGAGAPRAVPSRPRRRRPRAIATRPSPAPVAASGPRREPVVAAAAGPSRQRPIPPRLVVKAAPPPPPKAAAGRRASPRRTRAPAVAVAPRRRPRRPPPTAPAPTRRRRWSDCARRWPEIVERVSANPLLKPLVAACRPVEVAGRGRRPGLPRGDAVLREKAEQRRAALEDGVEAVLGRPVGGAVRDDQPGAAAAIAR